MVTTKIKHTNIRLGISFSSFFFPVSVLSSKFLNEKRAFVKSSPAKKIQVDSSLICFASPKRIGNDKLSLIVFKRSISNFKSSSLLLFSERKTRAPMLLQGKPFWSPEGLSPSYKNLTFPKVLPYKVCFPSFIYGVSTKRRSICSSAFLGPSRFLAGSSPSMAPIKNFCTKYSIPTLKGKREGFIPLGGEVSCSKGLQFKSLFFPSSSRPFNNYNFFLFRTGNLVYLRPNEAYSGSQGPLGGPNFPQSMPPTDPLDGPPPNAQKGDASVINLRQAIGGSEKKNKKNAIYNTTMQSGQMENRTFGQNFQKKVVSITYEEIGLFPRSFNRVFDRFLKQIFSDVENLVLQEYRFYRYLFLTTLKTLFILFFLPFLVNVVTKTYIIRPLTEYFWNTQQTEIFLNSYQQKRAFNELEDFEEKLFFESLIYEPKIRDSLNNKQTIVPLKFSYDEIDLKGDSYYGLIENKNAITSASDKAPLGYNSLRSEPFDYEKQSLGDTSFPLRKGVSFSFGQSQPQPVSLAKKDQQQVFSALPETGTVDSIIVSPPSQFGAAPLKKTEDRIRNSLISKSQNDFEKNDPGEDNFVSIRQQLLQKKLLELAVYYNDYSIEAITNFFADLVTLITLFYLLYSLEIQINITKSFLLEIFFGLDDSKKSLLILLITDLLVGYHSPNIWELFFEFIFHHYGIPESQTVVFLLVATLPVLLDVLFKYLIFRHLNRSSPATVATYHAMIE